MRSLWLGPLVLAVVLAPGALGWVAGLDRPHHADLAWAAVERLPPEWRGLIEANEDAFRQGALDPDGATQHPERAVHTYYHTYTPHDGGGGGLYRVRLQLHEAVVALREGEEAEAAYQLGFLTHFATDLAQPMHTGEGAYDSTWHEEYEKRAYDERGSYDVTPQREPREVGDVDAYVRGVAERSAAMAPRLIASLEEAQAPWTPEAREITEEAAKLSVEATADLLYTAFALSDPARAEPSFTDMPPVPRDLEEMGLSLTELQKHHLGTLVALVLGAGVAIAGAAVWVARVRAGRRASRRPRGTRSSRP